MMTDPIADMFTRLRNANTNRSKKVAMPASVMKVGIAQILKEEGFIKDFSVEAGKPTSRLIVALKYGGDGEQVMRHIDRISRPGRRVYAGAHELPSIVRGMGIQILSTPKGILSDRTARRENVGGEILCKVY
jgi:small subunit ribosomal protein S8